MVVGSPASGWLLLLAFFFFLFLFLLLPHWAAALASGLAPFPASGAGGVC
jgi:hypothetical protein